jgi:RimJ/RimL family protein N-acetyltransferase
MEIPTSFSTSRLLLRAYAPGDAATYLAVGQKNHAHLQRFESGNSILTLHTLDESTALIAELTQAWQARRYFMLGAFEQTSGEFVAQIYVGVVNWELPEMEVGYFVDVDHEGQGYVSEAVRATLAWIFTCLEAHRVSLRCSDANPRSARVAEHCGFQLEGHLRETHHDPEGGFNGDLVFGLLSSEFQKSR